MKQAKSHIYTLIEIADVAYGDSLVRLYHTDKHTNHGDSLAQLIAGEIESAVEEHTKPVGQTRAVLRKLTRAHNQLTEVCCALGRHLDDQLVEKLQ